MKTFENKNSKILYFKNLYSFSILNFLEKFLAYLCPLLVIQISDDQNLYNQIELIYSFSIIFNILFDFWFKRLFHVLTKKIKKKSKIFYGGIKLF